MLINRNIVALFALPFMASATASELSIGAVRLIMNRLIAVIMKIQRQFLISYEGDSFMFVRPR